MCFLSVHVVGNSECFSRMPPCICGIAPTWAWNIIFSICRWAWFAGIFLKLFTSAFTGILVCCFLRKFLSGFAVRVILVSLNVS